MAELVIDCTRNPKTVIHYVHHQETSLGEVVWSPDTFTLWQSPEQHTNQKSDGYIIREKLAVTGKTLPPANILEALRENPQYIPKEWDVVIGPYACRIFALGTIFQLGGVQFVKCLTKKISGWELESWPLSFEMGPEDFSLIPQ